MTTEHNHVAWLLGRQLDRQLELASFEVRVDAGRARRCASQYYIPDVMVIPAAYVRELLALPGTFEAYAQPLPLIVEVWSPSTGDYDIDEKLPEYQRRGDLDIWRIHPYERALTRWQRQPDGSYVESLVRRGMVQPVALPGVSINFDQLFQ